MSLCILKIEDLEFSYDERPLLKDLSFKLLSGDKVGIIGKTGSGKSTLLYLIMGFLKPRRGKICLFSKEMQDEHSYREIRKKVGLLFQDSEIQLFCPTVREDIAFGPLNQGKTKEEVLRIINDVANFLEINHLLDRSIFKLSGGEKKLCALAGIIAMNPDLYLLDEPTNGLDVYYREKIFDFLKKLAKAFILVSHDLDLLKGVCNKIYQLEDGRLSFTGL
ncbi:MAG: energy-coupling factor ABC transporter ATP-binding protein [Caldimicrobium sp.]|nr:energy-coupling factor ABC transporter ATP-binding protein [Caldimicrobium sp.]MCX7613359.1 energy-coupling factor ABC transporter ATP-binding protein [Caldimicrobium sp.]MDW8182162.1 ABC transporter ATP-binding protein [Caldimicrobium sp.]